MAGNSEKTTIRRHGRLLCAAAVIVAAAARAPAATHVAVFNFQMTSDTPEWVWLEKFLADRLITDFYAYNAYTPRDGVFFHGRQSNGGYQPQLKDLGLHWVGDLAVECDLEVQSESGELILDLVEGGAH